MEEKSTALNAKDAAIRVTELESPTGVLAFVSGDYRVTVFRAADERLKELGHSGILGDDGELKEEFKHLAGPNPKQGQTGPITEAAGDFKEGVQGKKDVVTCEDVIRKMRREGKTI